jgi:AmmeMemoRadiSam system protein B/AmmeMemoRadiSam system protein A
MVLHQVTKLIILILVIGTLIPILIFVIKGKAGEVSTVSESKSIRKPAVAGQFYPSEKSELEVQVSNFLSKASEEEEKGSLRILIVPHAGYEYSGQVVAWGVKQLTNENFSQVILLGSSHNAWYQGAAIDDHDVWETPLGPVEIDKNFCKSLIDQTEDVSFSASAHAQEHSLEVELPFLQKVLSEFKLVPVLLADADENLLDNLSIFLAGNLTEKTLVVISTDLSHYPRYEVANEVDKATIESILSGDPVNFDQTVSSLIAKGYPNLSTCACAEKAVKIGMKLAQKLGKGKWKLLKYANSGDTGGDKGRVVGYAAIGWYEKARSEELNKEEQEKLLGIARETLESYLENGKIPEFEVSETKLLSQQGAFVTLRKKGQLRGCIGEFEAKEALWKIVRRMAIETATKDPRFPPVRLNELTEIDIEVSVLSPLKKISDPDEIELGVHGVMIKKGLRQGVFLPQVATETGWDKETFMGQLCSQKAGLAWDCWKKKDVELFIYTAQVFEEESALTH